MSHAIRPRASHSRRAQGKFCYLHFLYLLLSFSFCFPGQLLLFPLSIVVVLCSVCYCPLYHLLSILASVVLDSFCCPWQLLLSSVASVVLGSFCCPRQLLLSSVASVDLGSFCCPLQLLLSSVASVVLSSFCCPWQLLLSLVASVVLGSFQVSSLTPIFVSLQFLLLSRLVSSFYYCLLFVM